MIAFIGLFALAIIVGAIGNYDLSGTIFVLWVFVTFIYICYLLWLLIAWLFSGKSNKEEVRPKPNVNEEKTVKTGSTVNDSEKQSIIASLKESISTSLVKSTEERTSSSEQESLSISRILSSQSNSASSSLAHSSVNTIISIDGIYPANEEQEKVSHRSSIVIHHLRRKLTNFVVVDIETTGLEKDAKIIQLSAIRYENDEPVEEFNKYINPGTLPLPQKITVLTGITTEQLSNAPKIEEVIGSFMTFVGTLPWVGHNINSFDIPRLVNNGLPLTEISTVDTLNLARKKLHMERYGLEDLKHYYGIHNQSHNSLEDCKTNAVVYQNLRDNILTPYIDNGETTTPQPLNGLRFAVTGAFSGYSRDDIKELIKSHGGIVTGGVSRKTNYLVDGTQVADTLTDGVHSSKEIKAKEYGTKVITLDDLLKMIK